MKKRTFIILVIILGILVGAGAVVMHFQTPRQPAVAMGSPLLQSLPANDIVSIKFDGVGSPVTLNHMGDEWVVQERFGYPADFKRITDLVHDLKDAKVGRMFVASEADLKRLSLKSPDHKEALDGEKAMRVRMLDGQGEVVLDLSVGDTRTRGEEKLPDGQFVRLGDDPRVYLIDQPLTAYLTGPAEWVAQTPVAVEGDEVQEVRCLGPDPKSLRFAFVRPDKDKPFEMTHPKVSKKIKHTALNRLTSALSSLKISDVTDPSTMPQAVKAGVSPCLIYTLFNGMVYRVYPGNDCPEGLCYVRFEVDYQPPGPDNGQVNEEKESRKPDPRETAKKAEEENLRLHPWVFIIPKWQHKAFITHLDELVETQKGEGKG